MRRALVFLVAIVIVVGAVVALAPATIVSHVVESLTKGSLMLAETEGTVWRGRGTVGASPALRIPLAWRIAPLSLLQGEAHIAIVPPSAGNTPRADIAARTGAVTLRALDITLPAEAVAALAPRSGVRLGGELHVTAPSLQWTRASFGGNARVEWSDAQFAISNDAAIRLGTVIADLAAAGDRLAGPVTNAGGDFDVRGTVSLRPAGLPDVALTMTPREGDPAQTRSLALTARPDGSSWNVEYRAGPR